MVRRSSGNWGGPSRLTRSLCLTTSHRPLLDMMRDGKIRDFCNRLRSGTRLGKRTPMAVASVNFRSFLLGGSIVDSTGGARRLRVCLCRGVHE